MGTGVSPRAGSTSEEKVCSRVMYAYVSGSPPRRVQFKERKYSPRPGERWCCPTLLLSLVINPTGCTLRRMYGFNVVQISNFNAASAHDSTATTTSIHPVRQTTIDVVRLLWTSSGYKLTEVITTHPASRRVSLCAAFSVLFFVFFRMDTRQNLLSFSCEKSTVNLRLKQSPSR